MDGLLDDLLGRFDNRSCSDAKVIHEFVRLPAVGNGPNREFVDLHAFRSDRIKDGVAQPSVSVMILYGEEATFGRSGTVEQSRAVDWRDAVKIDHPYGNSRRLELIVCLERFEKCHARCDDREDVRGDFGELLWNRRSEIVPRVHR